MKYLTFAILILSGCGASDPQITAARALPNDLDIVSQQDTNDGGGIMVSIGSSYLIFAGKDGGTEVLRFDVGEALVTQCVIPGDASSVIVIGSQLIASMLTKGHTTGSEYQSEVITSSDMGTTWAHLSYVDGLLLFTKIPSGTGIAASLWYAPQTGYRDSWVDFGSYENGVFTKISRLATKGKTFPSEVTFYIRPTDKALVAVVRWGEYPEVPYATLRYSLDNGATWQSLGATWPGKAGSIAVCFTDDGRAWAAGYDEFSTSEVYSAVWEFNPETGALIQTNYPLGVGTGFKGNGGIGCQGNNITALLGNGTLQLLTMKEN